MIKSHLICFACASLLGLPLYLVLCKSALEKKTCGGGVSPLEPRCRLISPPLSFSSRKKTYKKHLTVTVFYTECTELMIFNYMEFRETSGENVVLSLKWRKKKRHQLRIVIKLNFNNCQFYCTISNRSHKSAQEALVQKEGSHVLSRFRWFMNSRAKQRENNKQKSPFIEISISWQDQNSNETCSLHTS